MSEVLVLDAAQQDLPTHPLILSNICHLNVSNLARGGTRFPLLLLTTSTVDGKVTAPPACVVLDKKKKNPVASLSPTFSLIPLMGTAKC